MDKCSKNPLYLLKILPMKNAEQPLNGEERRPERLPENSRAASAGAAPRFVARSAAAADLDAVCGVVAEVVAALLRAGIDQWDEQYPDRACLDEDIRRGELRLVLLDGVPAALYAVNDRCDPAYAAGRWRAPEVSFRVLHRFCVAPAFQGTGLGGALLRQLEASLRAQGVAAVRLDVFTRNPAAQALYRRAGYRRVGQVRWRKGLFDLMEKLL